MKLQWDWCELCDSAFIRCPKCGNNSCNGGYGQVEGKECDVCPICYQYQHLAYTKNCVPSKKEIENFNKELVYGYSSKINRSIAERIRYHLFKDRK